MFDRKDLDLGIDDGGGKSSKFKKSEAKLAVKTSWWGEGEEASIWPRAGSKGDDTIDLFLRPCATLWAAREKLRNAIAAALFSSVCCSRQRQRETLKP